MRKTLSKSNKGESSKFSKSFISPKTIYDRSISSTPPRRPMNLYLGKRIIGVLKITLMSGEIYALDLTSNQHGYHEPAIPWVWYEIRRKFKSRLSPETIRVAAEPRRVLGRL